MIVRMQEEGTLQLNELKAVEYSNKNKQVFISEKYTYTDIIVTNIQHVKDYFSNIKC